MTDKRARIFLTAARKQSNWDLPDWNREGFERFDYIECAVYSKLESKLTDADRELVRRYGVPDNEFVYPSDYVPPLDETMAKIRESVEVLAKTVNFKPGLYQHYKGGFYRALFTCTHHETGEVFVAYVSQEHLDSGVKLREWQSAGKDSWTDEVDVYSDEEESWTLMPRFAWVGP